jgi:hypothetical protein
MIQQHNFTDAVIKLLLFKGLNVSINQLRDDPEGLWDVKNIGLGRALEYICSQNSNKVST